MVRKMRVAMALQPVATALFANSPFREGQPTDYLSLRSHVWTDVDNDRSGILPFVFDDDFGYERYVDYVLDTPMYFVHRDGVISMHLVSPSGTSWPGSCPRVRVSLQPWATGRITPRRCFPKCGSRSFSKCVARMEARGGGSGALPAFWVGLLYDSGALDAASEMIADWSAQEVIDLRNAVPAQGLATPFRNRTLLELAREALEISRAGLKSRALTDFWGQDESHFPSTLEQIADSGLTPAENKLAAFEGRWDSDVERAFEEYAW